MGILNLWNPLIYCISATSFLFPTFPFPISTMSNDTPFEPQNAEKWQKRWISKKIRSKQETNKKQRERDDPNSPSIPDHRRGTRASGLFLFPLSDPFSSPSAWPAKSPQTRIKSGKNKSRIKIKRAFFLRINGWKKARQIIKKALRHTGWYKALRCYVKLLFQWFCVGLFPLRTFNEFVIWTFKEVVRRQPRYHSYSTVAGGFGVKS